MGKEWMQSKTCSISKVVFSLGRGLPFYLNIYIFLVVVFAFVCFIFLFWRGGGGFLSKFTRLPLPDPCAFTFCYFGAKPKLLRQVNIISNGMIYSTIKGFWFVSCLRPRMLFLVSPGSFTCYSTKHCFLVKGHNTISPTRLEISNQAIYHKTIALTIWRVKDIIDRGLILPFPRRSSEQYQYNNLQIRIFLAFRQPCGGWTVWMLMHVLTCTFVVRRWHKNVSSCVGSHTFGTSSMQQKIGVESAINKWCCRHQMTYFAFSSCCFQKSI